MTIPLRSTWGDLLDRASDGVGGNDEGVALAEVRDVYDRGRSVRAESGAGLGQRLLVDVGDDDERAVVGELLGDAQADSLRAAGDHGDTAVQGKNGKNAHVKA